MKVCIDPGHGGIKSGAVFGGLEEKDVNLAVAKYLIDLLKDHVDVFPTRTEDIDVGLWERCEIANKSACDIFISIHCNADPDDDVPGNPEAKGEEIWFLNGSEKGKELAQILSGWVDAIFPNEPFRGIKGTDSLYVLKQTDMPAVLVEIGFIDNSTTLLEFQNPEVLYNIAFLIFNGIKEYFQREVI